MKDRYMLIGLIGLFFAADSFAQKGDELLVYSMKGTVTVIENNKESNVKIGKVLKPGSSIKTQPQAKLTMVCKQGKPLSVTKAGTFPIIKWKDSCSNGRNSLTSKFFKYMWDQLYVRSEDYKNENGDQKGSVAKNDAPVRGDIELEIEFIEGLNSMNYASGSFPLSWKTSINYSGKYYFTLTKNKTNTTVYADSVASNFILLDSLKRYMRLGESYSWSVATKRTGTSKGGIVKYQSVKIVNQQVLRFKNAVNIPEDKAAQYFRIAFSLENSGYPADAFLYYQKAATEAPEVSLYQQKLDEFKKIFRPDMF